MCAETCPPSRQPVCGDDGTTYDSVCHLQRQACRAKVDIAVAHGAECQEFSGSGGTFARGRRVRFCGGGGGCVFVGSVGMFFGGGVGGYVRTGSAGTFWGGVGGYVRAGSAGKFLRGRRVRFCGVGGYVLESAGTLSALAGMFLGR